MSTRVRNDDGSKEGKRPTKPGVKWRARVKVMGMEMFLGTYETKAEADAVEDAYRQWRKDRKAGVLIDPRFPNWTSVKNRVLNGREYLK